MIAVTCSNVGYGHILKSYQTVAQRDRAPQRRFIRVLLALQSLCGKVQLREQFRLHGRSGDVVILASSPCSVGLYLHHRGNVTCFARVNRKFDQ
jgi:hypothetical protein